MGLFDSISAMFKGEREDGTNFDWHLIESTEQFGDVIASSNANTQVIFKHSPRCATSFFVRKDLESFPLNEKKNPDFHMVDVIKNREISDKFGIRHESPQLFVIRDGEVIWHGSHNHVQKDEILKAIHPL